MPWPWLRAWRGRCRGPGWGMGMDEAEGRARQPPVLENPAKSKYMHFNKLVSKTLRKDRCDSLF